MNTIISNFKWIMIVCGVLTCTMFLGLISPEASLQLNFGASLETGPENIIVRMWSAVIGLMGLTLIYGAIQTQVRKFSLAIVGISKIIFITIALIYGSQYLDFGLGTAVLVDVVMVLLFTLYLIFAGKTDRSKLNSI